MSDDRCPDCGSTATTCWDCAERDLADLESDLEATRVDVALLAEQVDAARVAAQLVADQAERALVETRAVANEVMTAALRHTPPEFERELCTLIAEHAWLRGK